MTLAAKLQACGVTPAAASSIATKLAGIAAAQASGRITQRQAQAATSRAARAARRGRR